MLLKGWLRAGTRLVRLAFESSAALRCVYRNDGVAFVSSFLVLTKHGLLIRLTKELGNFTRELGTSTSCKSCYRWIIQRCTGENFSPYLVFFPKESVDLRGTSITQVSNGEPPILPLNPTGVFSEKQVTSLPGALRWPMAYVLPSTIALTAREPSIIAGFPCSVVLFRVLIRNLILRLPPGVICRSTSVMDKLARQSSA